MSECVAVSDDMVAVVGRSTKAIVPFPMPAFALAFDLEGSSVLRCRRSSAEAAGDLVLYVSQDAIQRVFGFCGDDGDFHLPDPLRRIASAIQDCGFDGVARTTFRLAKSIELLCEAIRLIESDMLLPLGSMGVVSAADARRLSAARRCIDERWREKLTIDDVARASGMNRNALTKGFREVFQTSVAEAISQRRLNAATELLRGTDEPISAIGYNIGYLNNAAFSRAFGRRFGMSPSEFRASSIAA